MKKQLYKMKIRVFLPFMLTSPAITSLTADECSTKFWLVLVSSLVPSVVGQGLSSDPQSIPRSVRNSEIEKSGPKASKPGTSKSKMSPSFSDSELVLPSPLVFSKIVGASELSKSSLPLTCSLLLCHLVVLTGEEKVHWLVSIEKCFAGLTIIVLEEIIVQLLGVVSGVVLS